MSSDEADTKTIEDETKDKSVTEENGETDAQEKVNNKASKKKGADPPKIKQPAKKRMKTEQAEKESKKEEKKAKEEEKEEEEEENENEESAEENDVDNHKTVPLLDQPLEVEGSRRRKEVQRFIPPNPEEDNKEIQIPEGKGKALGEIEIIDFNIQRAKPEDLKVLHRLCFGRPCKAALLKKNIKKFHGYDFEEASDEYEKRKANIGKNKKLTVSQLKNVANILDVEKKSGPKDEILERILSFLVCPVDTGKKLPGVGRSKRSGASNKNYDEGDEKFSSKKRSKAKKKSEDSEESEKEKTDDEELEEKEKKTEKKKNHSEIDEESKLSDEEKEEEEEEKPKKGAKKGKKIAEKKAPPKKRAAAKKSVEKSESEKDEESDEDEPLAKKTKAPPTDEEIKTYVKSLLDGANLELITMKKVCHDVYAHYPDFDLGHKKDFIKTTVKSLISS